MQVISIQKLREFWEKHPDAKQPLSHWYKAAENADWARPHDVRQTYKRADPIGGEFVVFDICNNDYRLVVKVDYKHRCVYVWDVLTHAAYDEIDFKQIIKKELLAKKSTEPKRGK